jgi:nitrogen fixation protein NifB
VKRVFSGRDDITVVGIAGPGDPFANAEETLETFRLIRKHFPETILCLSTNGLGLEDEHIAELAELKVSHVTLTINAVDPEIAGQVYAWARYRGRMHRGIEAGKLMIQRQFRALEQIKASGMIAKVNSILVPGVNDHHLEDVAKAVRAFDADMMNCIPLLPVEDTAFEHLEEPDGAMKFRVRLQCGEHMNQMTHCARCRADAVGKLSEGMTDSQMELLRECAALPLNPEENRPCVAVTSLEGALVNQHLGEAARFLIFEGDDSTASGYAYKEVREAPRPGAGEERWKDLADTLNDCRALLVSAAGDKPRQLLEKSGLRIVQMEGLIEEGLRSVYRGQDIPKPMQRSFNGCSRGLGCGGDGTGCG